MNLESSTKIGIVAGLKAAFSLCLLYGVIVGVFWLFQKQIGVSLTRNVLGDLGVGALFPSLGLSAYVIAKESVSRFGTNKIYKKLPSSVWLSISIAIVFYAPFLLALISLDSILKHDFGAIWQNFGFASIFIVLTWLFSALAVIKLFRGEDEGVL
jgi:hypothetical protein